MQIISDHLIILFILIYGLFWSSRFSQL